jgi:hypothetical protein
MSFLKCCLFEGPLMENATHVAYALTSVILLLTWALYVVWCYMCNESGLSHHNCHCFKVSGET